MFDKLIESEPEGADFKDRRGFFIMSTVVVGILFLTAVVISIYAEDFSLGNDRIELEAMLAPVDMAAVATEPQKPQSATPSTNRSDVPIRIENMSRTDESTIVPIGISTERNTAVARPLGRFQLGTENTDPIGSGRETGPVGPSEVVGLGRSQATDQADTQQDLPPIKAPPEIKKPTPPRTLGVVNGIATYLPKPVYPPAAIAVNAQGAVNVQVMIDESGRVVAANASGGHPLLRSAAEQAARNARFTPTLLSKVPVKVTGVIVYNFAR